MGAGAGAGLGLEPASLVPPARAVRPPASVAVVGVHVDGDHVGAAAETDCRQIVETHAEGPGGAAQGLAWVGMGGLAWACVGWVGCGGLGEGGGAEERSGRVRSGRDGEGSGGRERHTCSHTRGWRRGRR